MKKLLALFLATSLLIPTQAYAATSKPTPKPSVTKAKVVKTLATKKPIQKNLIAYCHKVACLGIFVGSETGCDWWEINSNVLGIDPNNSTERVILGSLITLVSGSKAKTIKAILLTSDEPIADGLGIGAYTANCRIGIPTGKIPSNTYTITPNRS